MNLAATRLIGIGHLRARGDWQMAWHAHPHHEIIVVAAGQLDVELPDEKHTATVGDVLWYPRQVPHREWTNPAAPVESFFIGLDWRELPRPAVLRVSDVEGRLGSLARWLYAERQVDPSLRRPAALAFAWAFVAEYLRLAEVREAPLVTRLRQFMRQHLRDPLGLDDLALAGGLSKYHFVRRYRALTGRTPMADLRLVRLEAARDLLLTTNLPLKEIAPRCGLGDEFHLSRLFRRAFHHAPGQLRRRRRVIPAKA